MLVTFEVGAVYCKRVEVNLLKIENKSIYLVETHHFVLEAWAKIKQSHDRDLNLITLDRHTDTHYAFDHPVIHDNFEEFLVQITKQISDRAKWMPSKAVFSNQRSCPVHRFRIVSRIENKLLTPCHTL